MMRVLVFNSAKPRYLLLCFFFLQYGTTICASPLLLEKPKGMYPVGEYLEFLEDPTNKLTFDDVKDQRQQSSWQKSEKEILNFAYTSSAYWIRFSLENQTFESLQSFLELPFTPMDSIEFFIPAKNGTVITLHTGDHLPFHDRPFPYNKYVLPIKIERGATQEVWIRFHTQSIMRIHLILWMNDTFIQYIYGDTSFRYFIYGAFIVLAVYMLFIFFTIRERSYLYLVITILMAFLLRASLSGDAFELFWPNSPFWANVSPIVFIGAVVFWVLQFIQAFLLSSQFTPKLHKVLRLTQGLCLVQMGISIFGDYRTGSILGLASYFVLIITLPISVIAWRKGYRPARFMFYIVGILAMAVILDLLVAFDLLELNFFIEKLVGLITPTILIFFSFGLADRINLLKQDRENALSLQLLESEKIIKISETFKKFVPMGFLNRIATQGISEIELGKAENDTMSILFCDIRSFTSFSEGLKPQEVLNFLNSYFKRMNRPIHNNKGFIDKFIGDAIMALFDLPEHQEDTAGYAVNAAIEMHEELKIYNGHRQSVGYLPVKIGIGIHTGPVVIGTVGSDDRMDSTVIGDNVNLASRLEDLTKYYNSQIIGVRDLT
ncbi:7TM-DISM domain-containing protein [Deltaproteobacteria bacterium TL4]